VAAPEGEPAPGAARHQPGLRPAVPQPRPQVAAGPPPRPRVTTQLAPPARSGPGPRPRSLRLSAASSFLAAAAGGAGVLAAIADGDALREKLTAEAAEADPGLAADAIADGVAATTVLVLGSVAFLSLMLVLWTALVLRRRPWARWPLLATGALTLAADDVAQSVVSGGSDLDRIAFIAQAGLVVVALVSLFWRSTGRWLGTRRD
jgi:hypothetical protein